MVQGKPLRDLVGRQFYRYTVVEYLGRREHRKHWWSCLCECGNTLELNTSRITGNTPTRSCGCLRVERLLTNRADPYRHGYSGSLLYAIYHGMLQRCYNHKNCRYMYYGAKGITVCQEWVDDKLEFFKWAEDNGYQEGLSIDRLDSKADYYPENCQWVTVSENSRRMNESKRDARATEGGTG